MDANENDTTENNAAENDTAENSSEETSTEAGSVEMLACKVAAGGGVELAINDMLKEALDNKHFNAVLIPHRVPAGDSFVYLLIQDQTVLANASPLAPIMPIQGANALSSVTHLGTDGLKLAAVLRPCEVRAVNELSKLDQNLLEDVTIISIDCPGVLPTKVFNEDPEKGIEMFNSGMKEWNTGSMRPACQVCDRSNSIFGDLHIGRSGIDDGSILVIQKTNE